MDSCPSEMLPSGEFNMPDTLAAGIGSCSEMERRQARAKLIQSAPAVCVARQDQPELHNADGAMTMSSLATQCASSSTGELGAPAGLFTIGKAPCTFPREHSSSVESYSSLFKLKTLPGWVQNSPANISATIADTAKLVDVISSKCEPQPISTTSTMGACEKKILYPNYHNSTACPNDSSQHVAMVNSTNTKTDVDNTNDPVLNIYPITTPTRPTKSVPTYSMVVAPPNTYRSNSGYSPECGVVMDKIHSFSLDTYAWALVNAVGKDTISFLGWHPSNDSLILAFMKSPELADSLVEKGIWFRGRWQIVSHFQQPATKLVVSGVLPFVPDSVIIESLSPYGTSVYPMLRMIPAAVRGKQFKGICSYRRELYLLKSASDVNIPDKLFISFLGVQYPLEISSTGPKCFTCGSLTHTISKCQHIVLPSSVSLPGRVLPQDQQSAPSTHQTPSLKKRPDIQSNVSQQSVPSSIVNLHTDNDNDDNTDFHRESFSQCNIVGLPPLALFQSCYTVANKKKRNKSQSATASNIQIAPSQPIQSMPKKKTSQQAKTTLPTKRSKNEETPIKDHDDDHEQLVDSMVDIFNATSPKGIKKKRAKKDNYIPILDTVSAFPSIMCHSDNPPGQSQRSCEQDEIMQQEISFQDTHAEEIESQDEDIIATSHNPSGKTRSPGASSFLKTNTDLDLQSCQQIIEDWLIKTTKLKFSAKKKLVSQLIVNYPNIEDVLTSLSTSDLYAPSSAKGKKVKELLSDIKMSKSLPRSSRNKKTTTS